MDVLLFAPLMAALLLIRKNPLIASTMLSLAAAIKIWPLLLAPILFKDWRDKIILYIGIASLTAGLTAMSLMPMLLSLNEQAGLVAYSANWTNSSFLFPILRSGIDLISTDPNRMTRYFIALLLASASLWLGLVKPFDSGKRTIEVFLIAAAFVLLSPTGYPWYFIWFLMFLPFAVQHPASRGIACLTIGASLYFARYKLGEAGRYEIYTNILIPIAFGVPLLIMAWDSWKARKHV